MSEILVQFDEPQRNAAGQMFTAEVRGQRLLTGLWEAWIEFQPRIGGDPLRTPPETEQLSRGDLRFWAAGITRAQLADALERAVPWYGATLQHGTGDSANLGLANPPKTAGDANLLHDDAPVLDPIALYHHSGEYCLRQELRALDAQQLAEIIGAFGIEDMDVIDLARTYEDALAERIVAGVQHHVDSIRTFPPETDNPLTK